MLAEQTGVPVAPWSGGPVEGVEDGARHARRIGYPLIDQVAAAAAAAAASGSCASEDELAEALERTQVEAQRTFGDPTIFMERLVEGGRHVEVQVIADQHGNVWAPGRARLLGAAAQPEGHRGVQLAGADARAGPSLRESPKALVKAAGYVGAGTVEFLYQPEEKLFTFLEVNTRLQVEHPVTEATTGLDIVKLQLHVAAGGAARGRAAAPSSATRSRPGSTPRTPSRGSPPRPGRSSCCGCRPGRASAWTPASSVGDVIPPAYDSMVAKVIAWGRDRPEALARLRCALRETTVVLARRHDDEVLPARPAGPARGGRRHRRHRLAGPHRRRRRRVRAARTA